MFQSSQQVQVTIDAGAAPVFELSVAARGGAPVAFERSHPFAEAVADQAYDLALRDTIAPLPAGAIRVLVVEDEYGTRPDARTVAAQVARRLVA